MGDRGLSHQVGTLYGNVNDLHSGGISQIIYTRDYLVTWSIIVSIASDRDPRFTTHFWESFQLAMGTQLVMSVAFHP